MLRIKSKKCTVDGCNNPRFSRGLCKFHRNLELSRVMKHRKVYQIRKVSVKRKIQNGDYHKACVEADQIHSWDGVTYCFFCLHTDGIIDNHHHVAGRGKNLLKGIVPCHGECHLAPKGFHGLTPKQLVAQGYIDRYLDIYKSTDETKYKVFLGKLISAGYEGRHKEQ